MGSRHWLVLKLAWYWRVVCRWSVERCMNALRLWLSSHRHASQDPPHKYIQNTTREVRHYLERRSPRSDLPARAITSLRLPRSLSAPDEAVIAAVHDPDLRNDVRAILEFIHAQADDAGNVPEPFVLGSHSLRSLCGERRIRVLGPNGSFQRRRASVLAVEELRRLRVLTVSTDYSVGRHGRKYCCWYVFGSGELPAEVLRERPVQEGSLQAVPDARGRAIVQLTGIDWAARSRASEAPLADADKTWWWLGLHRRIIRPADFLPARSPALPSFEPDAWSNRQAFRSRFRPKPQPVVVPPQVAELLGDMDPSLADTIFAAWRRWTESTGPP